MNLTTIVAVSDDKLMTWQVQLLLESFREHEFKGDIRILIFKPKGREWIKDWEEVEERYLEIKFFRYEDDGSVNPLLRTYHTIHRAYSMLKHWEQFPELESHAIMYLDSDILLNKKLDLEDLLQDDINYGADIKSYNGWDYFEGKQSRVRPEKLDDYLSKKPVEALLQQFNIDVGSIKAQKDNCAGVHYLLKNVKREMWEKILYDSVPLIKGFEYINQKYMEGNTPQERRNNGFQSFCMDIWRLLWYTYNMGGKTIPDKRLNFSWSTDSKERDEYWIHNCSITSENHLGNTFYKGAERYINNIVTPFDESEQPYIDSILNCPTNQNYINNIYTEKIKNFYNKYKQL